jgi:hypothetical protein
MNPKKAGAVFIILMIALIAYGFGSFASVVDVDNGIGVGIIPSNLSLSGQQAISTIGDPSFDPVSVNKRVVVNVSNNTTVTVTNLTNQSNGTNNL